MKVRAVILAGGEGSRLGVLTSKRTKPAVPFAGKYRIIDFTLSNCVNSGIYDVMLVAQYRPHSLIEHIGAGSPWDLNRDFSGGVRIYTPYTARRGSDWFTGTADAIQQNFEFIMKGSPDLVLILSGDHIYTMDYEPLITFHLDHQADMTMATIKVPAAEASRFGILDTAPDYRVKTFVEKPAVPPSNLANMGVYLFNLSVLDKALWEDAQNSNSSHDFGKDIIPKLIREDARVFGYPYSGYWVDVGTSHSYWQAHMDLLKSPAPINLNNRDWIIHTRTEERPPVFLSSNHTITNSMVADGCVIAPGAEVVNCVLSPGVSIGAGARVVNSILFTDTCVKDGATVYNAITDKRVIIGARSKIGAASQADIPTITTIGKNSFVPDDAVLDPGVEIEADVLVSDYPSLHIKAGQTITAKKTGYDI
jgi:glucose-1-phosphate adenylyltransferase